MSEHHIYSCSPTRPEEGVILPRTKIIEGCELLSELETELESLDRWALNCWAISPVH